MPSLEAQRGPSLLNTDDEHQHIAYTVWRVRRLYEQASGSGVGEELSTFGRELLTTGESTIKTLISFANVVEYLVQEAEQMYGTQQGLGAVKARQVRAASVQLLLRSDIQISGIPSFLLLGVFEIASDLAIDIIVKLVNLHDLWDLKEDHPELRRRAQIVRLFAGPAESLGNQLARLGRALMLWRNRIDRSSELMIASLGHDVKQELIDGLKELETFAGLIAAHREQLQALIEVAAVAVHESETFIRMSGPQKKRYAESLVSESLTEIGIPIPDFLIDAGIEFVVAVFNRHGALRPHTSAKHEAEQS